MAERIKLGLTRNRLFEFYNCVSFLGEVDEAFDIQQCERALKILSLKEPLLGGVVELCENGEAYIVTEKSEPSLEVYNGDEKSFVDRKKREGIDFSKQLFSFAVLNDKTLGVFAHTVVADVRTLMYLAGEFMNIYRAAPASVVPSETKVISDKTQLPSKAYSIVIERLASDLEIGWQKNPKVFTKEDCETAREKYLSDGSDSETIIMKISEPMLTDLKAFAKKESVDVSSLIAFSFYEALTESLGGKRRYKKLNVQANERVFFEDSQKMRVGAFNGLVTVEKKKNKKVPDTLENNAINFHKEIYKRITNSFSVFYNEFLFLRLPENFADSQYMYCSGVFQHKYSEKLANTYGCANEVVVEFCSYNLNQSYWSSLNQFRRICPSEPLKMRSSTLITFVEKGCEGEVYFNYKKDKISDSVAQNVVEKVAELLKKFK